MLLLCYHSIRVIKCIYIYYVSLLILRLELNYVDAYCNEICNIISHLCMAHNRSEQHSREPATYSTGMHPAWYWGYKLDYGLVWKWMSILWHDSRWSNSELAMDPWEGSHELQKCQKWQDYCHEWGLLIPNSAILVNMTSSPQYTAWVKKGQAATRYIPQKQVSFKSNYQ